MEMLKADILSVLLAYGVFLLVYIANILFSLYLNIEVLNENFDKYRLGQSVKKAAVLVLATLMLVAAIDATMLYFSAYLPELGEELKTIVTVVAIVATIGKAAIKYLIEAYSTFQKILSGKTVDTSAIGE